MTNENKTVDLAALDLLCDKLECGDANHRATAEQIRKAMSGAERTKTEHDGVDVDALLKLADHLNERTSYDPKGDNLLADTIRNAIKNAKPQLPEGIVWPRFEDGELVKFGDEYVAYTGEVRCVEGVSFAHDITFVNGISHDKPLKRPEPEVFDADGVPIKVGDTVYAPGYFESALKVERFDAAMKMVVIFSEESLSCGFRGDQLTHRKPDTQEAIDDDLTLPPWEYCERHGIEIESGSDEATIVEAMCRHLLERQRKLMGGE